MLLFLSRYCYALGPIFTKLCPILALELTQPLAHPPIDTPSANPHCTRIRSPPPPPSPFPVAPGPRRRHGVRVSTYRGPHVASAGSEGPRSGGPPPQPRGAGTGAFGFVRRSFPKIHFNLGGFVNLVLHIARKYDHVFSATQRANPANPTI